MSRIIDLLKEVRINEHKVVDTKLINTVATERVQEITTHLEVVNGYKFTVELGVEGFARDAGEISDLRRNARNAIIEEIFGEFRPMLIMLDQALWNRDFAEARRRLQKVEAAMFTV